MATEVEDESSSVPYRRATWWLLFGIPLLCLFLSTCGAGVVLNIDELRKKNLPENGGGQVLVEAAESSCWKLVAYNERHPDGSKGEPEAEVAEYEVEDEGLVPFEAKGCGADIVNLPADQVFGAVEIATGGNDEAHPVRNLLIALWLTRRGVRLGAHLVAQGSGPRYIYAGAAGVSKRNPVSQVPALRVTRSQGVQQALREHRIDPEAARHSAEQSFQAVLNVDTTDAAEYQQLMRRALQDAEVALQFAVITERFLRASMFPVHRAPERWIEAFRNSLNDLQSAGGGSLNKGTADALIDAAYDRQHDAIRADIADGYYLDRARASLDVLRALRPARAAEINELASDIEAESARQEAEERAEQERLDDLFSDPGSGYTGGLSCDGDGDGICYE